MRRIVVLIKERCNPQACGYWCMKACPVNRTGKDCIKPADGKVKIDELLCTGCGICTKCPFGALKIINLPEELKSEPIHRYGVNGFALFKIPIPRKGKVIGILGVNGIGKSTALKILSGILKPNLGVEGKEAGYRELAEFFKGSEAQAYFEELSRGGASFSYKPQQVEMIPKMFRGKVIELLLKISREAGGNRSAIDRLAKRLEIDKILERGLSQISGGELQRVAIASSVLKGASTVMFDEPSSYLDIRQRMSVAKFIREQSDEGKSSLVVEHDLILLDYMADLVHIMYGEEYAFGVVSGVKGVREGINTFLEGYIKEENVRFRDHRIKIEEKPPPAARGAADVIHWEKLVKKLGKFSLNVAPGGVGKGEVIGVVGENGIGKSTFIKILSGEMDPDKGKIDKNIRISYKPQYLEADDKLVEEVLKRAVREYKNELVKPLNVHYLMKRKLSELSGGELQRVMIARTLSEEADIYLLDEPSAYIDVEQRLVLSRIIREFVRNREASALVVDHDLLFIDYISERLIVFSGEPSIHGESIGPLSMEEGMNLFLSKLGITLRRDAKSKRPRINKEDSRLDRVQKSSNKRYYA